MYTLDLCRICLTAPVDKDIRDLQICENNKSETYVEILLFCLDIQVVENSAMSTKLCGTCYKAILTYYRFKTLALRNDHYLRTIKQPTVKLEHIITNNNREYNENDNTEETHSDTEISQYSLNKDEPEYLLENDDTNTGLEVPNNEVKVENVDSESDDDSPLTTVTKPMEAEKEISPISENEMSVKAGACHDKKLEPSIEDSSEKHVTEEDHQVSESCVAVKEAHSSMSSNDNDLDINPPEKHKTFESPNTDETEQNLKKKTEYEICDEIITGRGTLQNHIGLKLYACEICNKKFIQKVNLENHIKTHTDEKPYAWACDKKFTRNYLQTHVRIHTVEKPYGCKICGKKFKSSNDLQIHIRIHTGETPYACNICNKKFNQKGSLNIHIRTHTGEKPYACDICDKKFAVRSSLQRHIKIHTVEKPYSCEVCDKKFIKSKDLVRHIRTHTGEKPYACKICDRKFTVNGNLKKHMHIHRWEALCFL